MKLQALLFVFLMTLISACSVEPKDENEREGGQNTSLDLVNKTDLSLCNQTTPTGVNIYSYTWHQSFQSKADADFSIESQYRFSNRRLEITNVCSKDLIAIKAQIEVPVDISSFSFRIFNSSSKTERITVGEEEIACTVEAASETLKYRFRGLCLEITDKDGAVFLMPATL